MVGMILLSSEMLQAVQDYTLLRNDRNCWIQLSMDGEQLWVEVDSNNQWSRTILYERLRGYNWIVEYIIPNFWNLFSDNILTDMQIYMIIARQHLCLKTTLPPE